MKNTYETREEWLVAAVERLRPLLEEADVKVVGRVQISVGMQKSKKTLGCCYCNIVHSKDGETHNIFICPTQTEAIRVLDIVLHELIHAGVGYEEKHKGEFAKAVKALGLAGKPTATYAEPGSPLHASLGLIAEALGPYPHEEFIWGPKKEKAPGGGWVKFWCSGDEDYILRVSPKALEKSGRPLGPDGVRMVNDEYTSTDPMEELGETWPEEEFTTLKAITIAVGASEADAATHDGTPEA